MKRSFRLKQRVREMGIDLYLLCVRAFFNWYKRSPLKEKVTFMITFEQNPSFVYQEIKRQKLSIPIVMLYKKEIPPFIKGDPQITCLSQSGSFKSWITGIYHLATSKYIIVDNYYGILSAMKFKDEVICVQLWHAAGAIKKFGLEDASVTHRSAKAVQRFKRVYTTFHKILVGSDEMMHIFHKAFELSMDHFLKTGIPRTDLFFDSKKMGEIQTKLYQEYPKLREKKVILYAPTYRDHALTEMQVELDIKKMYEALHEKHVLLLKLHPAVQKGFGYDEAFEGFLYDLSLYPDVNELLTITDYLITDYSSIPYEFALLKRPMIFYPYDLEAYQSERGLWDDYEKLVPGPIVFDTEGIIRLIQKNQFDMEAIARFSEKWNKYSNGKSSLELVNFLFQHN